MKQILILGSTLFFISCKKENRNENKQFNLIQVQPHVVKSNTSTTFSLVVDNFTPDINSWEIKAVNNNSEKVEFFTISDLSRTGESLVKFTGKLIEKGDYTFYLKNKQTGQTYTDILISVDNVDVAELTYPDLVQAGLAGREITYLTPAYFHNMEVGFKVGWVNNDGEQ